MEFPVNINHFKYFVIPNDYRIYIYIYIYIIITIKNVKKVFFFD